MSLDHLFLYADSNALSEVSITLFLEQPLVKPKDFEPLVLSGLDNIFQDFKLISEKAFSFSSSEISLKDNNDSGFEMTGFDQGKRRWVIHAKNTHPYYSISIHCLRYDGWTDFKKFILIILNEFSELRKSIYVKAFNLTYVDQFNWLHDSYPPLSEIFKDGDYIPSTILNAKNDWNYSLDIKHINDVLKNNASITYFDNINIFNKKVEDTNYHIGLIHSATLELKAIETIEQLLEDKLLEHLAEFAHSNNKEIIKSLLRNAVLNKMGINNKKHA